ncbi:MAG: class I SAM-dependent methyltransferase [Planctomycetes bacterium]|nr:class I SAM-dependent methyltransferase [Planctomycetota bacterium]
MSKGRESGMPDESYWDTFFNPECIVAKLDCAGLRGNVLEFGCGYGTFTIPTAKLVHGNVVALDIDPDMVSITARKAEEAGLPNVTTKLRDFVADGCGVPEGYAEYAMLFNILHIENPVGLLKEAYRVLAPGGKAGIIHWRSDIKTPRGPSPDIRPSAEQCRVWGEQAGLNFDRYESLCCCSWHWGLVMSRPTVRI